MLYWITVYLHVIYQLWTCSKYVLGLGHKCVWYATSGCIHSKLGAVGRVVRWLYGDCVAREESYLINITGPLWHWVVCIHIGVRLLRHSKTQTANLEPILAICVMWRLKSYFQVVVKNCVGVLFPPLFLTYWCITHMVLHLVPPCWQLPFSNNESEVIQAFSFPVHLCGSKSVEIFP